MSSAADIEALQRLWDETVAHIDDDVRFIRVPIARFNSLSREGETYFQCQATRRLGDYAQFFINENDETAVILAVTDEGIAHSLRRLDYQGPSVYVRALHSTDPTIVMCYAFTDPTEAEIIRTYMPEFDGDDELDNYDDGFLRRFLEARGHHARDIMSERHRAVDRIHTIFQEALMASEDAAAAEMEAYFAAQNNQDDDGSYDEEDEMQARYSQYCGHASDEEDENQAHHPQNTGYYVDGEYQYVHTTYDEDYNLDDYVDFD